MGKTGMANKSFIRLTGSPAIDRLADTIQKLARGEARRKGAIPTFAVLLIRKNRITKAPLARPTMFTFAPPQGTSVHGFGREVRRMAEDYDAVAVGAVAPLVAGSEFRVRLVLQTMARRFEYVAEMGPTGLGRFEMLPEATGGHGLDQLMPQREAS